MPKANKLSDMPDFNDLNKLGSGKEMVERLTNLIASSRTQPSTSHKIEPMVMTSSATPMNTLCAYDVYQHLMDPRGR